ncbi:unnamed protein product [Durusdinium trenchii]|uniref:Uncharacterized protein n=2 Tax=Durusdinium trenchii TaxID=1381693 RepID=A0ABP0T0T5_9DINO
MAEEAAQAAPAVPKVTAPALASRLASSGLSLPKAPGSPSKLQLPGSSPGASPSPSRVSTSSWKGLRGSVLLGAGFGRTSFFAEKQALVLCFGEAWTKVGLSGESRPRAIFRSTELQRKQRLGPDVDATLSLEEWVKVLSDLLNRIFFQHLHLSPKDRRIVVCDAVFSSRPFRSALATVLFKVFSVHSLCFVLENVLPLYLTGLHTGLVIDLGYSSSRVLPTFAGVPVLSAFSDASCGAKHLLQALKVSLSTSEEAAKALEDETLLEDCLVCACYVACDFPEDGEYPARSLKTDKDAEVRIAGSEKGLRVPAACRCAATELFFEAPDTPPVTPLCACETVPEAFVRALQRSPVDLRAPLVQNVVLCGGCATLPGLLPRLAQELQKALRQEQALSALATKLRFTPVDFAPVCAAWTGGAIFGALEGLPDYSAEDFNKGEPLPDWMRSGFV